MIWTLDDPPGNERVSSLSTLLMERVSVERDDLRMTAYTVYLVVPTVGRLRTDSVEMLMQGWWTDKIPDGIKRSALQGEEGEKGGDRAYKSSCKGVCGRHLPLLTTIAACQVTLCPIMSDTAKDDGSSTANADSQDSQQKRSSVLKPLDDGTLAILKTSQHHHPVDYDALVKAHEAAGISLYVILHSRSSATY
jgi:hypothetical protein